MHIIYLLFDFPLTSLFMSRSYYVNLPFDTKYPLLILTINHFPVQFIIESRWYSIYRQFQTVPDPVTPDGMALLEHGLSITPNDLQFVFYWVSIFWWVFILDNIFCKCSSRSIFAPCTLDKYCRYFFLLPSQRRCNWFILHLKDILVSILFWMLTSRHRLLSRNIFFAQRQNFGKKYKSLCVKGFRSKWV